MKKMSCIFLIGTLFIFQTVCGPEPSGDKAKNNSISFGFLQGGGSLLGVDYERMINENVSYQIGGGFIGIGASLLYHIQPSIDSMAGGITYWNQGIPFDTLSQQIIGLTAIFRPINILTTQIGIGYVIFRGEEMRASLIDRFGSDPLDITLLFSIGLYHSF